MHELRTPLAVAATNLDLATTTLGLDDELERQLAAARRGLERLARTVDDLAVHGRLAVAGDGIRRPGARGPGARRRAHGDGGRPPADRSTSTRPNASSSSPTGRRCARPSGNLLTNALRLAPVGSIVRLAAGRHADWAWIAVRDEGPGLADADHERAFHRYWRGRYDVDREGDSGTASEARGLGLTIARQLTEAQGGHVTVRSAVGIGSTFVVWLPASPDARSQEVVADDGVHHRVDPLPGGHGRRRPAAPVSLPIGARRRSGGHGRSAAASPPRADRP